MEHRDLTKYAPFAEAGKKDWDDPALRTKLFGEQTDEAIGRVFVDWVELRHAGDHWDPEAMNDVGRLLESVGCRDMDARLAQWYRSTRNEHRLALLAAFLRGYWWQDNLSDESIIDLVIDAAKTIDRTTFRIDHGGALWMLHCLSNRATLLAPYPGRMESIRQFVEEQKQLLKASNELDRSLASLLGES